MSNSSQFFTDREEIVRLTVVVSSLVEEVRNLTEKVEELKDDRVVITETKLSLLEARNIVSEERLRKIEENGIWMFRAIVGEGLALIGGIILWWIKS